ncbi:MAG: hypothetical protein LBK65_09065 [Tannerellaceae bacterium]|nr:hypothetical protein [Tannerellaceae bacterium]
MRIRKCAMDSGPDYFFNITGKVIHGIKGEHAVLTNVLPGLPRSSSYFYSILRYAGLIPFDMATQPAGAGCFACNPTTGETGKTPFPNAPGTILDASIFA